MIFGKAQLISAGFMGFSHGSNDAQKTMGIITLALFTGTSTGAFKELPDWAHFLRVEEFKDIPLWVVVTCALTMAAGTAAGGWRIIRTMGHKMVKMQPVHGFAAETTAALILHGIGIGFATSQLTNVVLSDIPPQKAGSASGAAGMVRQVGTALGIALIGAIFLSQARSNITHDLDRTPVHLPDGPAVARAEPGTACLVVTSRIVDGNERVEYRFSDGGSQSRALPGVDSIYLEASRTLFRDPNQTVLLRADRTVRWAIVDRALDALERAGATHIVFATARGESGGRPESIPFIAGVLRDGPR